jgi:PAS domain S-box-containing protein
LRVAVVGGGRVEDAVAERRGTAIEVVSAALSAVDDARTTDNGDTVDDGDVLDGIDCVVVDGGSDGVEPIDVAERLEGSADAPPVVVLADGWDADRVTGAISTGVSDVLPRTLVDEDPGTLVERIAAAADAGDPAAERERRSVLFGNNPDPVVRIRFEDGDPIIRAVNPAFESVFGFDADRVVGESLVETLVPEAERADHERIRDRVRRGEPLELEATRLTADGEREFRFRVIHFESGGADGATEAYVWYTDVTDRNRRERLVRRLHEFTGTIQNAASEQAVCDAVVDAAASALDLSDPVCWLDDGALRPVAGDVSGDRGDEEARVRGPGTPADAAYDDGDVVVVGADETAGEWSTEDTLFLPLGDHGVVGAGIPDGADADSVLGDAARILGRHAATALDRVAHRRERRETERRFRLIADRIDEVIFLSAPDFSEVFYVNDAYEELWGEPVETLYDAPRSFIDAIDPRDRESFEAEFHAMLDDIDRGDADDSYVFEYRIRRGDDVRWVRATGYPVDIDDKSRFVGIAEDVTERRELESTYRGIFENVSDGLVIQDPETGEIRAVNDRFCEMNGYDREELLGEPIDVVTEPEYTTEEAIGRIRAAREEGPQLFEVRNRTADGETFPVEVHLSVVEIRGEERVLGSVRDVSERQRTERRLSEVLDRIDEAVYIARATSLTSAAADPDYLSSGYEEIWGEPLEAIRERYEAGFFDTLHPDDRDDYRAFVERVAEEVEAGSPADSYDVDYRIQRPDGEVRWVRSEYYPIEWGDDAPRVVVVSRDVTERKRLRRNLRMIAERVDEAIYMASPDKREVYYASPSFEDLWDLPIERVYEDPQAFIDRVHPDDREWFREEYDRIRADLTDPTREPQDTYELEYRVRHPDGTVRWISVRGYPVSDGAGGVDRWIAVNRDVTERKARERRIASFDDATEDLATADSTAEAAETAVRAAREELELPAVGAFLYDDADGHLQPEATAGPLPDVLTGAIGPGDGRLWEAFATERTVGGVADGTRGGPGSEDGDREAALSELAGWRAIPLGTHGLLLVASPTESFGSDAVQRAHVLAATLEAALAHRRGQQRLADRERKLRTQTERADRLDRIARLARRVGAALTDASTPGEVERAVCDRLATSGPYDLAWVGGVEVGSDRLTPRAAGGDSDQYVDGTSLPTAAADADPHPAVDAWRTGEVCVADSIVGSGPASEWRQRALASGIQSVCAVPLTYNGVTHGVLTVGTDTPNSMSDRERETLSQLGTSIANALAGIERRRALESDETVELEFRGDGETLPFARAAHDAGCRVTHQRTVAAQDGTVSVYYRFEGGVPDDAPAVARRTLPGSVEVVGAGDTTLVEARADEWFGTPLAEYGGTLREASADPEATTITVEVPAETDVRSFVERLQRIDPSLELVAKRQHGGRDRNPAELAGALRGSLTDRQLEALRTALSAGYFEWPREHDSSEVARRLDITQPTFNKHLRIAERETFELLFGDDG